MLPTFMQMPSRERERESRGPGERSMMTVWLHESLPEIFNSRYKSLALPTPRRKAEMLENRVWNVRLPTHPDASKPRSSSGSDTLHQGNLPQLGRWAAATFSMWTKTACVCSHSYSHPSHASHAFFQVLSMGTNCGTLSSSYIAMRCSEIRSCRAVKTIQRWQLSCRFELVSSLDLSKSDFDTSWPLTNTSPQLSKASSRRADNMASTLKSLTVKDRRRNGRKLEASWWCGILTQMLLVDAVTWSRPLTESKNASGVRRGKWQVLK